MAHRVCMYVINKKPSAVLIETNDRIWV